VDNTNLKTVSELLKYVSLSTKMNDIHLMVANPEKYIEALSMYNVYDIVIHKEIKNYEKMIDLIKSYGIKAGIALNPDTDIEEVFDILPKLDLVLIMSVYPGRSGQKFIENSSIKINKLKEEIKKRGLNTLVSVDGGVCEEVLPLVKECDIVISSSYIMNDLNNIEVIKKVAC